MVPRDVMHKGLNLIHSPGMLSVAEADFLYDVAMTLPAGSKWVELGVWCGRSLWAAGCGLMSQCNILGLDMFSGELPRREGSAEIIQYAPNGKMQERFACAVVHSLCDVQEEHGVTIGAGVIKSRSEDVSQCGECGVDVLLVDAAHDYESVRRDLEAWRPKMRLRGVVIGHDYGGKFEGVTRAFDERFGDKCQKVAGTRFVKVQL
jgi:hypothetical protein